MAAFSLVELALALAILAFAFIGLLGLLPAGMDTFRKSMDTSVTSLITHRLVNEAQVSDFTTYVATHTDLSKVLIRHFDDEGQALDDESGDLPAQNAIRVIYQANVVVVRPPTLPGAVTANENLAIVTVQVANNPNGKDLGPAGVLWDAATAKKLNVPVVTYSTVIAGNNTLPKS